MGERQWTDAQQQCLDARGTVLVSAAAGSGKTAVLVERVIRLITDPENPVDVDQLLVVTFTKAAAAEMKQRLAAAINDCLAKAPGDRRLQRQLMLLPDAAISTVHSFCGNLIRAHFHRLPEVSPQFRVWEEGQTAPLRAEAMEEVLEACYEEHNPAFFQLVDMLGGARNDKRLAERVEQLYKFVQADPDPAGWLADHAALYREHWPVADSPYGKEIIEAVRRTIHHCLSVYDIITALALSYKAIEPYFKTLKIEHDRLSRLLDELLDVKWDSLYDALENLRFDSLPPLRECEDPDLKKRVQDLRNAVKKKVLALPELMVGHEEEIMESTAAMAPVVEALFDLVTRFSARYAEKKQRQAVLDFNDLEHLALKLLTEKGEDGTLVRSALAREIGAQYAHVMVDEYQDTNPTQEWLFRAISQNEDNLFFVGDVKQSIYAFRNATPELFINRRDRYPDYDGVTYPAVIRLGHNFRSRQSVTDTVNFLCRQLMTAETCGVDYCEGEELVAAATYPARANDAAELILIREESRQRGDTAEAVEARVIAKRLRDLCDTMTVNDRGGERPLQWGDVCILLRSVKGHASLYADELNRLGIPAVSGAGSGFYEAPEIACAISLLQFLDNPLADVALLTVLFSPLFGFAPDDLADIREANRHAPLFVTVRRRARVADELGARLTAFLKQTDHLRTLAGALPADRLLARIYEELSLPAVMEARLHGDQRAANLQQLLDMARAFEQNGYRGLSAFVRYLERESTQNDNAAPAPVAGGQNAVRIMSIHASKGLEFPVVFLAGLGREFNNQFTTDTLLLHRELGVGMDWRSAETLEIHRTLQRKALALRLRRDARAEDLRVLYVALTRARERLCMVITGKVESLLSNAGAVARVGKTLMCADVLDAARPSDWILTALLRHPDASLLCALAQVALVDLLPCDSHLSVQVVPSPPKQQTVVETRPDVSPDTAYLDALQERTQFTYPFLALGKVPAKLAASALAHRAMHEQFVATSRPAFFSETALTPAERGTAMHQFMQFANYEAAAENLQAEVRRLVQGGFLSDAQGRSLSLPRLAAFFKSPLYQRICAAQEVRREYAFTIERPAAACVPDLDPTVAAGETVLVQGIADCLFRENGQWIIVDYKTDRVSTEEELVARYRPQLELYAEALEKGLGEPVQACLLYSFALGRPVQL